MTTGDQTHCLCSIESDLRYCLSFASAKSSRAALRVTRTTNVELGTAPLNLGVALNQLSAEERDCQVTVLDPMGRKTVIWEAPIVLVP